MPLLDVQSDYNQSESWVDVYARWVESLPSKDYLRFFALSAIPCRIRYRLTPLSDWVEFRTNEESPLLVGTGPIQVWSDRDARIRITGFTHSSVIDTAGKEVVDPSLGRSVYS